jgi:hypothetical protein
MTKKGQIWRQGDFSFYILINKSYRNRSDQETWEVIYIRNDGRIDKGWLLDRSFRKLRLIR